MIETVEKYQIVNGTAYHKETPQEVVNVLEEVRQSRRRIKIYLGDTETGRDWLEEHDTAGTIGRSTGNIKIPLLIKTARSIGGGGILDHCILKIKDVKTGLVLYQNTNYQQPQIEIVETDTPGEHTHETIVNGTLYGRRKSLKSAERLKNKLL